MGEGDGESVECMGKDGIRSGGEDGGRQNGDRYKWVADADAVAGNGKQGQVADVEKGANGCRTAEVRK